MAIRSTNAGRHDSAMKTGGGSSGSGNRGEGNYRDGYPRGSTTPGYIDYRDPANNGPFYRGTTRQEFRDDPNTRSKHSPGSSRGEQNGFWETNYGKNLKSPRWDDRNKADDATADQLARDMLLSKARADKQRAAYAEASPEYVSAMAAYQAVKGSGGRDEANAMKAVHAAMQKAKAGAQLQRFLDQGGTEETYKNRFAPDANWPVPKSPLGISSHGPGRSDYPGGNDMGSTNSVSRETGRNGGRGGMIEGYLGSGGSTEDLPPGMTFDMPSQNILSALSTLTGPMAGGRGGGTTSKPASAPRGVRRGGGRVS